MSSHKLPRCIIVICATIPLLHHVTSTSVPLVEAPCGSYQGKELLADNGQTYYSFKGIPYAQPPVGELRFRKPVPVKKLDGVYDASDFKPHCVQLDMLERTSFHPGQEDCLFLNVYTPVGAGDHQDRLKKVYFFIHGGGNQNGFSELYIGGSLVTDQDIVFVTINYRLGYLGFMSTGLDSCPGNYGLWDQVEALKWVKANIRAFGGDPDGITISGESAGGMDTSFLTLASVSRDLFSQAFPMSGVIGTQTASVVPQYPVQGVLQIARREKCAPEILDETDQPTDQQLEDMVDCLRKVDALRFGSPEGLPGIPQIGARVDGELIPRPNKELFADKQYLESINFGKKKYMVGFDYNEGCIFDLVNDAMYARLPEEQKSQMPPDAMYHGLIGGFLTMSFGPVSQEVITRVADFYKNTDYIVSPNAEFSGDAVFHLPTIEYMNATSAAFPEGESGAYLFRFVNFPKFMGGKFQGTVHGVDLGYLFDFDLEIINEVINIGIDGTKWTPEDSDLKKKYMAMVGAFIKTGNPNNGLDLEGGWPTFDPEGGKYLVFNESPSVESHFQPERVNLWKHQIPAWIREFPIQKDGGSSSSASSSSSTTQDSKVEL